MRCKIYIISGLVSLFLVGHYAGQQSEKSRQADEQAVAMRLCSVPRPSYGNWTAFDGLVWHCFIEHPDYPHKIKRSVLIIETSVR